MTLTRLTTQLYVTDIATVQQEALPGVDLVVSTCQDSAADNVACAYAHFKLADGIPTGLVPGDPSYEAFAEAADCVRDALERGETVVVHCHMGQSRSVAVCVAVLAATRPLSAETILQRVTALRPQADPQGELLEHIDRYTRQEDS